MGADPGVAMRYGHKTIVRFSRDSWEWLMREFEHGRRMADEHGENITDGDLISDEVECTLGSFGEHDWEKYSAFCDQRGFDDFTRRFREVVAGGEKYEADIVFTSDLWDWIQRRRGAHSVSEFVDCVIANYSVIDWDEYWEAIERIDDDDAFLDEDGTADDLGSMGARLFSDAWPSED